MTKGDYSTQKIYNQDPLEVAKQFEDAGLQFLHLVDLDGAKSQHIVNYKVLEKIALKTNLKIDFGGGIKNDEAVRIAFENGASQITVGSISYQNPNLFEKWLAQFGADKIILGADAKNRFVATQGWLTNSETDVVDFIADFESKGVEFVVCTDIAKDGMLEGPSVVLYQEILQKTNVKLIASGGVSSMRDLEQLQAIGCEGAIIGKAIYEGKITLKELRTLC
uniref:1-(5-phosphoribosyl)-5-[(5- phosphoribosylamino)methylideneamino]imidazole-4- carboxamide isomerase n=1 Tax=Flavobacterium sp. TaxID=239 RepID=UPI00404A0BCF